MLRTPQGPLHRCGAETTLLGAIARLHVDETGFFRFLRLVIPRIEKNTGACADLPPCTKYYIAIII
ncbi:MAG: hypothetical protein J0L95_16570, partial [Candidatus Accumulibacter sp.]|uniref:hypothetical protein n=1 Tax=Accumulibacter sp. TaxID=2053492 RepID=UPI001AD5FAC2